jgi:hypothetical protein
MLDCRTNLDAYLARLRGVEGDPSLLDLPMRNGLFA